jgi:hypothetical protein
MAAKKRPKYDPADPWWVSLADLATLIGVERAMLDKYRVRLGNKFEHKSGRGRAAPVFVYAKLWLPAWSELRLRRTRRTGRLQRVQADIAAVQLRKLTGELVDVNEFWETRLAPFCDTLRSALERLSRVHNDAYQSLEGHLDDAIKALKGESPAERGKTKRPSKN